MLANIVDNRVEPHRSRDVNVVLEPTFHDNSVPGADRHEAPKGFPYVQYRKHVSLPDAVAWANSFAPDVTLFIYDAEEDPAAVVNLALDAGQRAGLVAAIGHLQGAEIAMSTLLDRRLSRRVQDVRKSLELRKEFADAGLSKPRT